MKPEMLAAAHWGYVESVLQLHGEQLDVIEKCGEHYKAAFVHGFKHGIEASHGGRATPPVEEGIA